MGLLRKLIELVKTKKELRILLLVLAGVSLFFAGYFTNKYIVVKSAMNFQAFQGGFVEISETHNELNKQIFFIYKNKDWTEKLEPSWSVANTQSKETKNIAKALTEIKSFIQAKQVELEKLNQLITQEQKIIEDLSGRERYFNSKDKKLAREMLANMNESNKNAKEIASNLKIYLERYLAFCEKREAFLKSNITADAYDEFVLENNIQLEKVVKELNDRINKILPTDMKVKEIFDKLFV